MNIAGFQVGPHFPCFVTGEIGLNHNGNLEIARQLIDVIVDAGAQAAKFQKRTIEICYTPEELARLRESPWGTTNGDQKRGLEFGEEDYRQIDAYAKKRNLLWFASPWDVPSVEFLEKFDVPAYKIASASLTDAVLLEKVAQTGKPVIMSTAMSSKLEIDHAVYTLKTKQFFYREIALLVCTGTYPAALKDLRLERIRTMKRAYPNEVIGYSGHETSPWPSLCAVAMGAGILERHVTLDRTLYGSDQAASLEPDAFTKLVTEIRDFEAAKGDGKIGMIEAEKPVWEKLRRVK